MNPHHFHFLFTGARWLLLALGLAALGEGTIAQEADLIFHSGRVVTVDEKFSIHQALAVRGEKIVAVGSDADILKLRGSQTQVHDLAGGMVIPGLIDSHTHAANACLTEFDHPIPTMESIADVLAYIQARTQVVAEGEWIVLQQIFITRLREQRYPTRAELDRVAPRHPVLFRTGPDAALNSLALHLSDIDRNFQVADGGSGFAEKDPVSGEPTGVLRNCTRYVKVKASSKAATPAEHEARLKELFSDYNSVGITSICDRDATFEGMERYQALRDRRELSVRVNCSHGVGSIGEIEKIAERIRSIARHPLHTNREDPWLRIIGVKTYLDGGMLTGSAYMREPWGVSQIYGITDPQYRGVLFIPPDRLRTMVRAAAESGLQFTAHAQGDGAVHGLLEAYDDLASQGVRIRETRCSVTHSSFMSEEAIHKAARLGVMVDLQPAWLYLDSPTLLRHFGDARLRWFIPLRSLFKAGVVIGGGSDHMQKIGPLRSINPYSPFLGMATAVSRRARGKEAPLHPEEALGREEALRFYTINNARLLAQEERTGSIEPGKLADFVLLDTDLLECPEESIAAAGVLRTYVGGKLVFERKKP